MTSGPKNLEEYIGDLSHETPEKIIAEIQADLEVFIDEIIKHNLHDLYLVGRKSRHLLHQLISSRLVEKSSGIHFLNVLSGNVNGASDYIIELQVDKMPQEISLLADSINEGKEKEAITNILEKQCNCKVNKIFCYVANQQGINYLLDKKVFTEDQIIARHKFSNLEYEQYNKRIAVYYQSRIEPMDVDHVSKEFRFSTNISSETLFQSFKDATKTVFGCDKGEYIEAVKITEKDDVKHNKLHVPETTKNYNFQHLGCSSCKSVCNAKMNKLFADSKVEYVQVRLKAELKKAEAVLCLMIFCSPDPTFISIDAIKANKCMCNNSCQVKQSVYNKSELNQDELMTIICPKCIENKLSEPILLELMGELRRNIEENLKFESVNKSS